MEALEKRKIKKKRTIVGYNSRHEEVHKNNKIVSITSFDEQQTNSIKLLTIEKKYKCKSNH